MKWQYNSNNKYFTNKFKAIDEFENSRHSLFLEVPDTYDDFDFSREPKEELAILLRDEAIKVREQNDYVRLFYSGGADSQAVLNAFVDNQIVIDEIVCFKSGFKDADYEIDNFAIPYIKSIRNKIVDTRISILTPSVKDYEDWYCSDWTSKYFAHQFTSTVAFFRLIDQPYDFNDGAINIKGKDKPKIVKHKGELYTYFSDSNSEIEQNIYHFLMENPAIISKQCHLLINAPGDKINFNQNEANNIIHKNIKDPLPVKEKYYTPAKLKHGNKDMHYVNEKERLALVQALKVCPTALDRWIDGTNSMKSTRFSKWFNQGRPEYGTVGVQSKFFCLTDKKVATVDELYPDGFTKENIIAMAKTSAK